MQSIFERQRRRAVGLQLRREESFLVEEVVGEEYVSLYSLDGARRVSPHANISRDALKRPSQEYGCELEERLGLYMCAPHRYTA